MTRLSPADWASLAATWDTDEYKADWGLGGINADYAYALGYTGAGIKVGVVDSGFDASHPELDQGNIHPVPTSGTYYADGYHFEDVAYLDPDDPAGHPHTAYSPSLSPDGQIIEQPYTLNIAVTPDPNSAFKAGDAFDVPGAYNGTAYNDIHGTHVTGTIGAARDGTGMHGVAFGADVYVANTDSTDETVYGPNADYNYFMAAYTAVADAGARAINNSWGSPSSNDSYDTLGELTEAYQRFFGKTTYLNAVAEIATQKGVIQVWAAGNGHYANPDIRSALPYLQPDLEKDWLAVGASQEPGIATGSPAEGTPGNVDVGYLSQTAGVAKYWTVFAPGIGIESTIPTYEPGDVWNPDDYGIPYTTDPDTNVTTYPQYATFTGTSMAAPHATGALAILMQRYDYLSNEDVRDVLLTTAAHHDAVYGTSDATSGANAGLNLAADDAPNAVWGWGEIDLKAAMNGPGQFLGAFTADLKAGQSDLWTNRITEDALIQRQAEDAAEQATWQQTLKANGWDVKPPDATSSIEDQVAYQVGMARAGAAASRVYQGSLIKDGDGLLELDGVNSTFSGGVALNDGSLEIGADYAAGTGDITFGAGSQSLLIDTDAAFGGGATFTNTLDDFGYGDTIDMKWIDPSAIASFSGSEITVTSGGTTYSFKLQGAPSSGVITVSDDGQGGTLLTLGMPQAAAGDGSPPAADNPSSPPSNNSIQPPSTPSASTPGPTPTTPSMTETTGITGEPYSTKIDTIDPGTGAILGSTYVKPNGVVYLTNTADTDATGGQTYTYTAGSFFRNKPYSSFADSYAPDGTLLSHVENNKDGTHTINGIADGQRLVSLGNDTFTDDGAAERFVFKRGAGAETITDFQVAGAGHDHIVLPSFEAGRLAHILATASDDGQGDTTLHLGRGETITLVGVSQVQLERHRNDFSIHA